VEAGKKYELNPLFILAQGAIESGWGSSLNCRAGNNFFGIIATKSWKGKTRLASTGLTFRVYGNPEECFEDFARLISGKYHTCASAHDVDTYAHLIAQSPYISEANGDNRENYEKNIKWAGRQIANYLIV
jgi:flagellar protein FlgJ